MSKRNHRNRKTASNGSRQFSAWGDRKESAVLGCPNGCRYCYARAAAKLHRRIQDYAEWGTTYLQVRDEQVRKGWRNHGTVRFPWTHDVTPEVLEPCVTTVHNLLAGGNRVIVCSKPRLECIKRLCTEFVDYQARIEFRFTITAMNDAILRYWEPGAPDFKERLACLRYAHRQGFRTSVNIEPMLDVPNVAKLFRRLAPHVNVFINIGKMERVRSNVQPRTRREEAEVHRIETNQADDRIRELYEALKQEPLVRWGRSISKVLRLKKPKKCG